MKKLYNVLLLALLITTAAVSSVLAQKAVTGTVIDNNRQPLPGVSVIVTGTTFGTVTDAGGKYRLDVPQGTSTLTFSFIGMETQVVAIDNLTQIDISMTESSTSLQEVVVVGYGTQKKVNLTGSVSSVNYEDFKDRPVQNVAQALQGVVNGLNISTGAGGGMLDVAPTINIRGTGTIANQPSGGTSSGGFSRPNAVPQNSISAPLILINGVEGDINSLNPQDIENISVLKDAASSSIYGSRAAFGVILVTTKSGKMGKDIKPVINYAGNVRFSSPMGLQPYANAWDATKYNIVAYGNSGSAPTYLTPTLIAGQEAYANGAGPMWGPTDPNNPKYYPMYFGSTDWNDALYKGNMPSTSHSLNIRGGGEKYTYYISGNRLDQSGLLRDSPEDFVRNTLNVNLSANINKRVKVEYIGGFNWTDYDAPSYLQWGFFYQNSRRIANQPVHYEDGVDANYVPIALRDGGRYVMSRNQNQHKFTVSVNPVGNWNIYANGSVNITNELQNVNQNAIYMQYSNGERYGVNIPESQFGSGVGDTYIGQKAYKNDYYTTNIYSDYFIQTDNGHYIKALVGFNAEYYHAQGFGVARTGLISPDVIAIDAATSAPRDAFGNSQTWTAAGFFGRINYNFKEKYLLEVNGRYDGASRFVGDQRWGFFPSVSAGWNISAEPFFEPLSNAIPLLKIRGSYGSLGNMNTTNWYPFYPTMPLAIGQITPGNLGVNWAANSNWLVNGALSNVSSAPNLVSSDLTWERVKSWDIGLDFGFFSNRLTGNFDIFNRTTEGMVGPAVPITNTLGTSAPATNNANLESKGFEVLLGWRDQVDVNSSPLSYGLSVNVSDEVQTITKYNNSSPSFYSWYAGRKLGEIWGYETIDIARTQEQMTQHLASLPNGGQSQLGQVWQSGDIMYRDINADGRISQGSGTLKDPGDVKIIGNDLPRYKFGITLTGAWKGFDLNVFFQGVAKRDMWPATQRVTPGYSDGDFTFWGIAGSSSNQQVLVPHLDYYRPEGDPYGANVDAYYPRPYTITAQNQLTQTKYLQDGAYLRLKNLQLGYSIPNRLSQKLYLQRVRLYVSGDNLYTWTKLTKVIDPEAYMGMNTPQGGAGSIGTAYPIQKVFSVGLNLTL
ncbi:MAG TPA: TonB-dependent receptor [Chryseolinea sp.]|nr:TonB-dependent receptor [Chryseolinea sp.]